MPPRKKAAGLVAEQHPVTTRSSRSKTKAAEAALGGTESSVTNKIEPTTRAGGVGAGSGSRAMTKKSSVPKELSPSPPTPTIQTTKKAAASARNSKKETKKQADTSKKSSQKQTARGKAKTPPPLARTTPPTDSSAEPESQPVPNNTVNKEANVAEDISRGAMRKRTRDAVELEVVNGKEIDVTKHKKAKTGALVVGARKQGTRKYTPFTVQNVEAWFETYQDEVQDGGKGGFMSPAACNRWVEELGISAESAAFYVLAWKLDAKTMFTLTQEEFIEGMKKLGIDSNEKLLDLLPIILDQVSPSFESLDFKSFYKFCFNYGKSGGPPGAKNVELPIAIEFLKVVLDQDRYQIDYTPPDSETEAVGGKKMEGNFPHLHTFIEFLQKATKLKVLNRDQWDSFLPFNKSVGWGLEGYSEDSAWPSLFDEYAEWKKISYPDTITQSNVEEHDDKDMAGYTQ